MTLSTSSEISLLKLSLFDQSLWIFQDGNYGHINEQKQSRLKDTHLKNGGCLMMSMKIAPNELENFIISQVFES